MPLASISLAVVGADFPNRQGPTRRFELAMCERGEAVELRLEPNNPADPSAIAVFSCRGIQIGYVTAERAPRLGQIMRQGIETTAIFQEHTKFGAVIRVSFDGDLPELPPQRSSAPEEHDFWPDPEYPEE